jgi:hypothetical protein
MSFNGGRKSEATMRIARASGSAERGAGGLRPPSGLRPLISAAIGDRKCDRVTKSPGMIDVFAAAWR